MNMKSHFGLRSHEQFSKMMPHGCIISCLLFNNFLTMEGQEIIFTRSLFNEQVDLSIQSIQRGISCNTCRLVGQHHQRSGNRRHQIWRNTKVFLSQMQNVWACRFIPSRSLGPLPLKGPELSLAFWRVGCLGEVRSSPAWSSFIRQHRSKI